MLALHVDHGQLQLRSDTPIPQPAPGEALLRVRLAGICATDLEIVKGYAGYNGILGHEFVGEVAALGADDDISTPWIGRRVVGSINIGCGECDVCRSNGPEHCPSRTVIGINDRPGAFAEYLTLPLENLLPVPEHVPDEAAVFTEPLAAAWRVREQVRLEPADRLAVVGPGRLGLLVGQVLALAGNDVTMVGRRPASLSLPRALGLAAAETVSMAESSFDLVVEATGSDAGLAEALRLVRPQGTLVMKSTFAGMAKVDLRKLVVAEIRIIGSRCGPFAPAMALLAQSRVAVAPMISATYSLEEAEAAFARAAQPGVLKVLLRP